MQSACSQKPKKASRSILDLEALTRKAQLLSIFTIFYNLIEGAISIALGLNDESLALMGFGADSLIEVGSAVIVLWKLSGSVADDSVNLERERRATRLIGSLFLLLAGVTGFASVARLMEGGQPEMTWAGLVISVLSLSFMFALWRAKKKVGIALESRTILADANCSLACIQLSAVLFAGSLLHLVFPQIWWMDSVAALALAGLIAREGFQTVKATWDDHFSGGCGCHG